MGRANLSGARMVRTIVQPLPLKPGASGGTYIPPEDTFEVLTAQPIIQFLTKAVQPPSAVYVTTQDQIVFTHQATTTENLIFTTRILRAADGRIVETQAVSTNPGNLSVVTVRNKLPEGFLLTAGVNGGAGGIGQTYVTASIQRDAQPGFSPPLMQILFSGYTVQGALSYPGSYVRGTLEGPGALIQTAIPGAAVGTNWTVTVPAGCVWQVRSGSAQILTSAVVGDRFLYVTLNRLGLRAWSSAIGGPVTAGRTATFSFGGGVNSTFDAALRMQAALPDDCRLLPGDTISAADSSIDGGDQWGGGIMLIEQWFV